MSEPEEVAGTRTDLRQDLLRLAVQDSLKRGFGFALLFQFAEPRTDFRPLLLRWNAACFSTGRCITMDSGYYAACAGLAAQTQALELVANNLANLGTAGFRGQQATFRSLLAGGATVAWNPLNAAVNDFGVLSGSRVDLTSGNLVTTGNPLIWRSQAPAFLW